MLLEQLESADNSTRIDWPRRTRLLGLRDSSILFLFFWSSYAFVKLYGCATPFFSDLGSRYAYVKWN